MAMETKYNKGIEMSRKHKEEMVMNREDIPIIANIKDKYHHYKREHNSEKPNFLVCDNQTYSDLLNSRFGVHVLENIKGEILCLGIKIAIIDTPDFVLEVR